MNPSAQPWYPPAELVLGAPTAGLTAVRWQNDPYRSRIARCPPPPLCGDDDFISLRIESLVPVAGTKTDSPIPAALTAAAAAAVLPTAVQVPVTKGQPYRSSGVTFASVPTQAEARLQKRSQPVSRCQADLKPLWRSFATVSSLDSQGDSQEIEGATTEEKCCAARVRPARPKVPIPRPRSQLNADNAFAAARNLNKTVLAGSLDINPHTPASTPNDSSPDQTSETPAVSASGTDTTTTDGENNTCTTSSPTDVGASTGRNNTCSEDAEEPSCEVISVKSTAQEADVDEKPQCLANRAPPGPTASKKTRLKPKSEKWTIVGGKAGVALASVQAAVVPAKRPTASIASTKARESVSRHRTPDPKAKERVRSKQRQSQAQHREEVNKCSSKDDVIIEQKSKRQRDSRRPRECWTDEELLETLMSSTTISAQTGASSSGNSGDGAASFAIMGVPLVCVTRGEELLTSQSSSRSDARQRNALRLFIRSLAMFETSNAKTLLLQRALNGLPESCHHQCPSLVCAIMLEMSASCVDVEKSLQTCYKALRLSERHNLDTFEMLSRLGITRTLARVVDTMDARENLTRAALIAIDRLEKEALGWIVMQMGVTLEISGLFPDSLAWYEVAERLARSTGQQRLLCEVHCCQSIAYSAVGELERAQQAYEASRLLLSNIHRHCHQRPLQNYAQLKCQLGDMAGALQLQEEELAIAKELGDTHAASRCVGAIALTKRFLGRYDEAAENYMEEFSVHCSRDPRQAVESLTGAASCWRFGGHAQKAYDYCIRALTQARDCHDLTTIAKALAELAETELSMDRLDEAQEHLREALTAVFRVDDAEQKQYLVKAALCEVEWRCCSALGQVYARRGQAFEAMQCADRCHVPNTVHMGRLLLRRQRCAGAIHDATNPELVSRQSVERVLKHPTLKGWNVVCYSLPWAEKLDFMVYVVMLDADSGELKCVAHPLVMSDELVAFFSGPNALWDLLDAPMFTDTGDRMYGDTPLWPQLYSKVAFDFQQNPSNAECLVSLRTDPHYCLRLLYDNFVRPLEADVAGAEGLMFVADGVFSRIPFHALHDGKKYLAERFCTSTCCSMALLCTHAVEDESIKAAVTPPAKATDGGSEESMGGMIPKRYTIVDDASHKVVLMDSFVEEMVAKSNDSSNPVGVCVRHWVVDEKQPVISCVANEQQLIDAASSSDNSKDGNGDISAEAAGNDDPDVSATKHLLSCLRRRGNVTSVRNSLYRAVHENPEGVLELRLRVVPEVKEDYCGTFVGASCDVSASHASEVASSWELRGYALVLCSGIGTYGGLSMHETGVPVYRALQYAGARCMLLAAGSRVPPYVKVPAAAADAALNGRSVAAALREAYVRAIAADVPLEDWCGFALVGLPIS
ncbi:hypothetical protein, conserved [Trypanosoma brucei brucei TREU927]|uniref:CHAT domain-containing protein n=1 Tax=Trypanosoma brucei brucei (strain 927/4 GUTat10.1) TaxID=185431 RepID=Q38CX9_TRYB2|nr:hypothetical protein, conserved [Trypanosoma brucei brucei TREU927]EAN77341.1 hypothetical protein, conserved [Trypanosoma brucei brucei TREU927]